MAAFMIKDVQIFTGVDVIQKGYVLVKDGQIESYGKGPSPAENVTVISKPGHTLLPGLIDAHIHCNS